MAWGPAALRCSSQQTGRIGLGLLLHGHGVGSRGPRRWCECQALAVGSGILVPEDLLSVPSPESPNLWSHCYHRWSPLQTCTPHLPTKARPAPPPPERVILEPRVPISRGGHRGALCSRSFLGWAPPLPLARGEAVGVALGRALETPSSPRRCLCPGRPPTARVGSPRLSRVGAGVREKGGQSPGLTGHVGARWGSASWPAAGQDRRRFWPGLSRSW